MERSVAGCRQRYSFSHEVWWCWQGLSRALSQCSASRRDRRRLTFATRIEAPGSLSSGVRFATHDGRVLRGLVQSPGVLVERVVAVAFLPKGCEPQQHERA